jgi:redox-sensitive bicupin YhaK (pirin superfamily)
MREVTENIRTVKMIRRAQPTVEGAGVNLVRAFNALELPELDPFLMLDDFHSDDPTDYQAGFPSHPHRGMETVTYMIKGSSDHQDSLGNRGTIGPGEVQWMTAGSGIIHGEMPHGDAKGMQGFQLWINLPRASKMMPPRYQNIRKDMIPVVNAAGNVEVRVIAGTFNRVEGPVKELVVPVEYLDVTMGPGSRFEHPVPGERSAFAYVFQGRGSFGGASEAGPEDLVVFGYGKRVSVTASDEGVRFLLVSGEPVREPIALRGPVVMNTDAELRQAFDELRSGTFVKR